MNFSLNSVNLALFQVLIMSPVVEMGEASIETRGSWFPATWVPVLMMIGRVPTFRQGWVKRPSFSAYDSYCWGKKMVYFSPLVRRLSRAETSCQMRNNSIWLFQLPHEEALAEPWGLRGGRAGLSRVASSWVFPFPSPLVSSPLPADLMMLITHGSCVRISVDPIFWLQVCISKHLPDNLPKCRTETLW